MAQTFFVNAHYEYDQNDPEQMKLKQQQAGITQILIVLVVLFSPMEKKDRCTEQMVSFSILTSFFMQ